MHPEALKPTSQTSTSQDSSTPYEPTRSEKKHTSTQEHAHRTILSLRALTRLDLGYNRIGSVGAEALRAEGPLRG